MATISWILPLSSYLASFSSATPKCHLFRKMQPCTLESRKPCWSLQTVKQDVGTVKKKQEIPVRTLLGPNLVLRANKECMVMICKDCSVVLSFGDPLVTFTKPCPSSTNMRTLLACKGVTYSSSPLYPHASTRSAR